MNCRQPNQASQSRRRFIATVTHAVVGCSCGWAVPAFGAISQSSEKGLRFKAEVGSAGNPEPCSVLLKGRGRPELHAGRNYGLRIGPGKAQIVPAQVSATANGSAITWIMPAGGSGNRQFELLPLSSRLGEKLVVRETDGGRFDILESGRPVLRYNYAKTERPEILTKVAESNRKYAVSRSNYIHPLHGFDGEELTLDWPLDHPHHRGIYWAWPEVDWKGERGDSHALQRILSRPTGRLTHMSGPVYAQIEAENLWQWEKGPSIVRETAVIRAYGRTGGRRILDLRFGFEAIDEPVVLARRNTELYGGLNLRLGAMSEMQITKRLPTGSGRQSCWGQISGMFMGSTSSTSVLTLQHAGNPEFPGDWVDYPNLSWLQPTFPRSGARYELRRGRPLVLCYRVIIHRGVATEPEAEAYWQAAHGPLSSFHTFRS